MRKLPSYAAALAGVALGALLAVPANATPTDPITGLPNGDLTFNLLGATTEQNTLGNENTWGIGTISAITQNGSAYFAAGAIPHGSYLNYMIYGVSDINQVTAGSNVDISSVGATTGGANANGNIHVDIYLDSSPISYTGGPAARTGFGQYPGVTNGSLWLSLEMTAGCASTFSGSFSSNAQLCQVATSGTAPANGSGAFYANVVGGSAAAFFDSNGLLNGSDVSGGFHLADASGNPGVPAPSYNVAGMCSSTHGASCFNESITDPAQATKVPEPSSLSIMGAALALFGAATWFRKKRAKAAA